MKRVVGAASLVAVVVFGGGSSCGVDVENLPPMTFDVDEADVWADGHRPPTPAVSGEARLLVTNNLDDTVSVVSVDQLLLGGAGAELSRFVVGLVPLEREGPHHVAASADGRFAYVGISNFVPGAGSGPHGVHGAGTADGRVLLIDLDTEREISQQRVDRNPGDVRLTPDGSRLLMTHFDLLKVNEAAVGGAGGDVDGTAASARLAVLDAKSLDRLAMIELCPAPHGVAITRDSKIAVSSCQSDEAAIVDLDVAVAAAGPDGAGVGVGVGAGVTRVSLLDEPGTAASPVCGPYAVTLSADESTAFVSCYNSGELIGVDVASKTRSGDVFTLPGHAVFGASASDGTLAVATQDTDGVVFIDADGRAAGTITGFTLLAPDVCERPHAVRFIDDDTHVIVVCEGNQRDPGAVIALDRESGEVLGRVLVGRFPDDLALQVKP